MTSESRAQYDTVRAVAWRQGRLYLLDQRRLPAELTYLEPADAAETAAAIEAMAVRGAPAIALAGAYGLVLEAMRHRGASPTRWHNAIEAAVERLTAARPTAVHLRWALERMRSVAGASPGDPDALRREAERLHDRDLAGNYRMGELGAREIAPGSGVLTHCNTGSLATAGYGTALGVVRTARAQGRIERAYVTETRPWRQGTRLTLWELLRDGIPATGVVDSAAAHLMAAGAVQWVIVGADRIAANGDVANKIGTYALAIAARYHGVGMMVVAPAATIDTDLASGGEIPIEQRGAGEILEDWQGAGADLAGLTAHNPVFDVTPAGLIDLLVTERGCVRRPDAAGIARLESGAAA